MASTDILPNFSTVLRAAERAAGGRLFYSRGAFLADDRAAAQRAADALTELGHPAEVQVRKFPGRPITKYAATVVG